MRHPGRLSAPAATPSAGRVIRPGGPGPVAPGHPPGYHVLRAAHGTVVPGTAAARALRRPG
ncbi:hypothetical protein ADZ36_15960 [Streptomyces fradiae]|uniref:Uncharacterized protein n=2 Tax=Streptomyces TaxID=1883 RepID=A0A3R7G286_9ACTN|nr:hypothetical protein ADZ36_15960 [Streptomyces fradiae]OFA44399.1 hypothetical protein BEN35_22335 [Streptomyces fradiae]PQM25104.1 hypothetical protein Sfr7A_02850 [Streptomyces xinghaiensis]RKM99154.1 hypothetical protein SFRA_002850 [Streptomyces xinghaiensis]RNC75941.1 hypothetical protein DC095_001525 [Streptomyces xinghaiensis]